MHFRLLCCSECQTAFASPAPEADWLQRAYQDADFDSGQEARFAARTYGSLLTPHLPRLGQRDGAVDVGAGEGSFLRELQALGFEKLVGVEPSEAPIRSAPSSVRPLLFQGSFDESAERVPAPALVSCFQTLEHLPDPGSFCRQVFARLRPGGLFLAVCHDYRAWPNRMLGQRSPIFDVEHLQLYCRRSLRYLARRSGFTGIETRRFANRYPLSYWARLLPLNSTLKTALRGALRSTRLEGLPVRLRVGNVLLAAWKPQTESAPEER